MATLKERKRKMFCTPFDVRAINKLFSRQILDAASNQSRQEIRDGEIETHIYDADSIIVTALQSYYSEAELSLATPYFRGPVPNEGNKSSIELTGITLGQDVITEQWVIEFLGPDSDGNDRFKLTGSFSGYQGEGTTAVAFASTNGDVSIATDDWVYRIEEEQANAGDQIVFATYRSYPVIRYISAKFAASYLLDALVGSAEVEPTKLADSYRKDAMEWIKKLSDPNSGVTLTGSKASDVEHETTGWEIDAFGNDNSLYRNITGDNLLYRGGRSFESGL